ncbi:MAG: TonB-dependent receptor domain-containing protein, partial [Candidatus Kapaibacterium sp.]
LDEALSAVPGALVQSRSGNQDVRVTIRGFGARGAGERSNAATTRGIRFLLNGLPLTEPDGRTSLDLVDMAAIGSMEVVRSTTTSLWGNAAGGVINMSTLPTRAGTFLEAGTSIGSFGFNKSTLQLRSFEYATKAYAVSSNTNFDGWRDHSQSTLFQSMAGIETPVGSGTMLSVHAAAASNYFRIPGPLTQSQFDADARQAQADSTVYSPSYTARDERRFNRVGRLSVAVDHTVANGHTLAVSLFAEPKFLQRSERNTFRDFTRYHAGGSATYAYDAMVTGTMRNRLLLGMDNAYQDGAILFYSLDPVTRSRGTTLRDNKKEGAHAVGLFAQDVLSLDDRMTVLVGLRSDNITYAYANFINPELNESRTFSQLSPKLGISYVLDPDISIYGNLAYGVEIPAGNETDPPAALGEDTLRPINSLLEPMRSRTIEVGMKYGAYVYGDFLSTLAFDVAAYHITTESDLVPYRGGRFYMSAGQTRRMGVEAGGSVRLRNGILATLSASLSSNTLVSYRFDSVYVNASLAGKSADFSGNTMPGLPSVFATLRLAYDPGVSTGIRIESELRTVGSLYADDVNRLSTPAYTLLDAAVSYRFRIAGNIMLRAVARMNNVLDTKYVASVWLNPDAALVSKQPVYIDPGLPRNWLTGMNVEYSF